AERAAEPAQVALSHLAGQPLGTDVPAHAAVERVVGGVGAAAVALGLSLGAADAVAAGALLERLAGGAAVAAVLRVLARVDAGAVTVGEPAGAGALAGGAGASRGARGAARAAIGVVI